MSKLKGSEAIFAESLKTFFLQECNKVDYREGEDPPDIYLEIQSFKF